MKISREAWDLKEECFGPLLPYVKDQQVTDINYNGTDVWIEHLKYGIRKAPVNLTPEFAGRFSVLISNIVSEQINKFNNVLEAETDTLRISIIHPSVTNTGYSISIRKTPAVMRMTEEKMLADGYCSREVLLFLRNCMEAKLNMVFCGCPGAGKTELLKFLTQFIPKHEKVMTIEDNLEIHYRDINPGANCVELKVDEEFFSYTKAIKSALRQNPQWVLLSEARSTEVKYLLECFSTGLHGLTTLHTDDTRKIPDRIQNMMQDSYAASRMENDIYSFLNVGILLCKKATGNGKVFRFVDQICLFDRIGEENRKYLIVENGKVVSREISENIRKKFQWAGIRSPFEFVDFTKDNKEEKTEQLVLFLERAYVKGISEKLEQEMFELLLDMVRKKAENLCIPLLLSYDYIDDIPKEKFQKESRYIYISATKGNEQYLDSLGGKHGIASEGKYLKTTVYLPIFQKDCMHGRCERIGFMEAQ